MSFKTNKNEKLIGVLADKKLQREFKSRANAEGMTLKEAYAEAMNDWLDKKLDEENAAIKAGVGSIGQAKRDPAGYAEGLEKWKTKSKEIEEAIEKQHSAS